ncbi:MAG: GNAT family N-acetyltransferase [Candidatus Dadabacteria bacterium]|nr:GNAT family N-acetyltransferase [Candidatus Dadabacteria bacterium]
MIRKALPDDLGDIVTIHMSGFDGFFLSSLGPSFLRTFYMDFLTDENGCCLVDVEDGRTVGFAAGVIDPSSYFRRTFRRRWPRLILGSLGRVVKNPAVLAKLARRALTYPSSSSHGGSDSALLSSIAVLPEFHNRKIGERLLDAFLEESASMGASEVVLTTDRHRNEKVIAFYKKMGFDVKRVFTSYEGRYMYELALDLDRRAVQ